MMHDAEPLLRASGVSISSNFTQVEGRVLPAPKVCYLLNSFFFAMFSSLHVVSLRLNIRYVAVKGRKWR